MGKFSVGDLVRLSDSAKDQPEAWWAALGAWRGEIEESWVGVVLEAQHGSSTVMWPRLAEVKTHYDYELARA
jgi:hypothetical protein